MLQIIVLAIIQGISEFLPISSSAHLIIFRDVFQIGSTIINSDMDLVFDIALHFGTLLAIISYFFKDFLKIIKTGLVKGPKDKEGKLLWMLAVATIPGAIAGFLFEDVIDNFFRKEYILIAVALIVMGVIIYLCDHYSKKNKELGAMTYLDAIIIGLSQSLALIPGFSRSGTTIATARLRGIDRVSAAKFSFYLSVPITLGAVILALLKDGTISMISSNLMIFGVGILVAFIIGILCIAFLLKYIAKHDFKLFMFYRILLAILVILTIIF